MRNRGSGPSERVESGFGSAAASPSLYKHDAQASESSALEQSDLPELAGLGPAYYCNTPSTTLVGVTE